jgi:hypothetical protein
VDYGLVEVAYSAGGEVGGLLDCLDFWVEGFSEVVFDGLRVDFVGLEKNTTSRLFCARVLAMAIATNSPPPYTFRVGQKTPILPAMITRLSGYKITDFCKFKGALGFFCLNLYVFPCKINFAKRIK